MLNREMPVYITTTGYLSKVHSNRKPSQESVKKVSYNFFNYNRVLKCTDRILGTDSRANFPINALYLPK